ncbi:Aldehyde/histidinol dehydrogenase [Microdochium trichocladiopsis]|uniref:Aldehyde/histidinol dehydrogenase n=1 Tax=Microdochium trichocladiopsis TaxID=1682393 RepID=A0A9P8XUY6_9PEZI|nr:Aldehyde/histidinol dehydrogenase [Microdochium trichocladiopsis]KAH7016424.1 Aldehyde/histidinol dehydrogenase [Microdochium trichocladiopsis]
MPSAQLKQIRSAAVDGRLANPIYRQTQLKSLHDALSKNTARIEAAIRNDNPDYRPVDVRLETRLALRLLGEIATAVNPDQALKDEYSIARGQDFASGRQPFGVVVIEEPAPHAFLYSLTSALAPAIAEGNVVVVQMKGNSLLETPKLVFELIAAALDKDVFAVVHDAVSSEDIGHRNLRVVQNSPASDSTGQTILSDPSAHTVAIVERDADIQAAADALIAARFSLGGRSPYAPDLVLVNEWVKRDLIIALSARSARYLTDSITGPVGSSSSNGKQKTQKPKKSSTASKAVEEGSATIISSNPEATIVEVSGRDSVLLKSKISEPCLVLHSVKSIDDAIDTAPRHGTLAATYIFAKPDPAKYIGQFVDSSIVFVNQIPPQLLFGPIAPSNSPYNLALSSPYTTTLFSVPKPQHMVPTPLSETIAAIMSNPHSTAVVLDPKALPPVKRLKNRLAPGFFEQGIVTGGLLLLSVVLSCTGWVGYLAFRAAKGRLF